MDKVRKPNISVLYAVVFLFLYLIAEVSVVTKLRIVYLVDAGFAGNSVVFFAIDFILSLVWVTYKTGFGLDDWIYYHLIHLQLGTTGNTALSLIYTHYSSPLHSH
jgi:hypothetical protein